MNGGGDGCADVGGGGVSGVDVGVGSVGVGTGVDGLAARVLGVPKAVPEAAPKAAPKATPEAVPEAAPEAAPAAGARRLAHSSGARRLRPRRAGHFPLIAGPTSLEVRCDQQIFCCCLESVSWTAEHHRKMPLKYVDNLISMSS